LPEYQSSSIADPIRDARQRLALELRAQADQIQNLSLELKELQQLHERAEQEADRQWEEMVRAAGMSSAAALAAAAAEVRVSAQKALENVLGAVRALMTCTIPEQVFAVLTEEAAELGVRAAIFDVRGKAAWGASAHGFGPALSENSLRALIVPLNQESLFRRVCETAGHVEANAESLKKNRNVYDKLKPVPHAPVLLVPVRSAGTVAAIFYADLGEKDEPLPVNALLILAEFAGAQIDRLIALSGGFSPDEAGQESEAPSEAEVDGAEARVEVAAPTERVAEEASAGVPPVEEPVHVETHVEPTAAESLTRATEEPDVHEPVAVEAAAEVHAAVVEHTDLPLGPPAETPAPMAVGVEAEPAPAAELAVATKIPAAPPVEPPVDGAEAAAPLSSPAPAAAEVGELPETEQKLHKDAKRFAKLLVSEIELYNKAKVADGRKNRDLYSRLKTDIDRSRQTFEKRFGKTLSKEFDYFHEELVKNLAANDSSVLGPEYPGPPA